MGLNVFFAARNIARSGQPLRRRSEKNSHPSLLRRPITGDDELLRSRSTARFSADSTASRLHPIRFGARDDHHRPNIGHLASCSLRFVSSHTPLSQLHPVVSRIFSAGFHSESRFIRATRAIRGFSPLVAASAALRLRASRPPRLFPGFAPPFLFGTGD